MSGSKVVPAFVRSRLLSGMKFYHISLNGDLAGVWTPGVQAGFDTPGIDEDSSWAYPEPPMDAVCVSPSLEGCVRGVFPNIARFFEKDNLPFLSFYVYQPVFKGGERIVVPETLTLEKLVWDAHVTQEHRILDKVEMKLYGTIKVLNTNKSETFKTHPFSRNENPEESVGPSDIKIRWF